MSISKKSGAKVLIIIFILIAIIGPFIYSCSRYSNDYAFKISNYEVEAIIDSNGDMHVVEKVTNNYNSRNTVFYKNLIYGKNNYFSDYEDKSSLVEDVRVKVEDSRGVVFDTSINSNVNSHFVGYSYKNDRDERGDRIRCEGKVSNCAMIFYYDARGISDVTTFTYEYTIKGVVTEYGDISEFNWVMLGYQPMNVENVNISITLPEGSYNLADEHTFFHGTNMAKREFVDNNKVVITTDELVENEQIEVRLLVDKDVFSSVRDINRVSVNRLDDILDFEKDQHDRANKVYNTSFYGSIILFVAGIGLLLFFTIRCYNKYDKEFKSDFYNEYYRELPADYAPAIMGYLYKFREINDDDLTATLLDLIRRKYLILENPSTSVNDDNPNYIIKLNMEKNLKDLTKQEKHLIDWFINDIGDGKQVRSQELSNYCNTYSSAVKYQQQNRKWFELVKSEARKYKFFDESIKEGKHTYSLLGSIVIVFIAGLMLLKIYGNLDISIVFSIILTPLLFAFYTYLTTFDRRSKSGNEDFVRWKAFHKFLEEFSTFEDYPVPSLIIWEHYLVYATSFGIADKVTSQLKLKFNLNEINDVDTTFILYYGLRYNHMRNLNRTISYSRQAAASTIARHNASRSSGRSVGGGGFSGGSSFGGGGGSFGGR